MSTFKKNDILDNKIKPRLIDPKFKEDLSMLLTLGAEKYEENNWKLATKKDIPRYRDALERHLIKYDNGEIIDKDTGLPHMVCIAFNSMALHYFDIKFNNETGNRKLYEKRLMEYKNAKLQKLS
jgi:hypothetical protein